ncbi:MAG: hypothetical protein WC667_03110 [Sulfurimonas sp.]
MDNCVKDTVFIVADFGDSSNQEEITKKLELMKETCSVLGLSAQSSKDFLGGGDAVRRIKKAIEDAEFIICDISEPRGYANPNVYYEFGFAHGCENDENDLFSICDKATFTRINEESQLPFDIRVEQIHIFDSDEELKKIVHDNLQYMIEQRDI